MAKYKVRYRNGICVRQHTIVWEKIHGPVPPGYQIHHKNGNGLDNSIDNLEILTQRDHGRIHAGFIRTTDGWQKRCPICDNYKPLNEYWTRKTGRVGKPSWCCKGCNKIVQHKWYTENKVEIAERRRNKYKSKKETAEK